MANDADLDLIRGYLAQGGKLTVDKSGNIIAPIETPSASTGAEGVSDATQPESSAKASKMSAAQKKELRQLYKDAEIATREPKASAENDDENGNNGNSQELKKSDAGKNVTVTGAKDLFGRFTRTIANLPTPGGNLALLLILVFFAWAVIPINHGATRVQLIWLVLTGRADLMNQPDTSQANDNGGKWWQPYLDPSNTANGGGQDAQALPAAAEADWADLLDSPRASAGL